MNNPYPTETRNFEIVSGTNPPRIATANDAASVAFPKVAEIFHAFWERQEPDINKAPSIEILDFNDDFFALTLGPRGKPKDPTVFVPNEGQFRHYNPDKGIYEPISEANVMSQLLTNLNVVGEFLPPIVKAASVLQLKNRQRLKSVVERAKDLLVVDYSEFSKDRQPHHLVLANGMLRLDNNLQFRPSAPCYPVTETLPVKYDPEAKCDLFLGGFLRTILEEPDIDLLQRYLSQVLEGVNHSQSILILCGDAGWGKSSLMKILGNLVGWQNIGIIREQLFKDEFELAHYCNKHLLYHPDLPTDFLDRPEASIFKQLVGGDPLWANLKDGGRKVMQGQFPTVVACNGKPRIHLDQDTDAWLRRLMVLSFKTPSHEKHFGKMAEMILKTEAPGILNWLLQGRAKLVKDNFQLTQTPEQKARTATLLLASDSPAAFVRSCLVKKKDSELGVLDLYEHYQEWCKENHIRPFSSRPFTAAAKEEIEIGMGRKLSHDLKGGNGKAKRGWKGVGILEATVPGKLENGSCESVKGSESAQN